MNIVSRDGWGARPATSVRRIATPTRELWLHHTADNNHGAAGVRNVQRYHMDSKGWSDIAYSFLVDSDGTVFEGRGAGVAGGHTKDHNSISHAICAMGNYQTSDPPEPLLNSIAALIRHGHAQGWWPSVLTGGHRDAGSTSCPGDRLYRAITDINDRALTVPRVEDQMPKLIKDPDGNVYECVLGQRWHIPDGATFDALGYDWAKVQNVKANHPLMQFPLAVPGQSAGAHDHDGRYVQRGYKFTTTLR